MALRIYLSGSVRKGATDDRPSEHYWTDDDEERIRAGLRPHEVTLLNPQKSGVDRSDPKANFGCDLYLVETSNVVLVDARTKKGIGIGAEMMFACARNIPTITIAPKHSHYRQALVRNLFGEDVRDWTHPFVLGLSDYVVESLTESIELLKRHVTLGSLPLTKNIDEAIEYYRRSQGSHAI
ncbi:hypothetical protein AAE026_11485 [Bradyrhizobium sp. DN5]|uniref:hypothetical protein n=1 Tax=Bradyrhizobium sp. DN5 TaxID=3056950 RepID=UPI0035233578